jgi:hypothetical protein
VGKRKTSRFRADGSPANRRARRDLGELVEHFGEIGASFKKSRGANPRFFERFLVGESARYFPLENLGESDIRRLAERAGELLEGEKLERVLDYLYAELNRRLNE